MPDKPEQPRRLTNILYTFTAVTGLVDAVAYLALGHVFTANMTGNIVLLGFATAGTSGLSVPRSTAALAGYLLGALIGGRIATSLSIISVRKWAITAFGIEAVAPFAATVASLGFRSSVSKATALYAVIVLTAVAMGIRNATVRKLAVADITTTVLTLTITGLAADSSLAGSNNPRWQRRILSVVLMFAGAVFGALLLKHSVALPLAVATLSSLGGIVALFSGCEAFVEQTSAHQSEAKRL